MGLKETLKLAQLNPSRVVAELADGTMREFRPAKDTRKKWLPIVEPMEKLEWIRAELFNRDVTVGVVDNPEVNVVEVPAAGGGNCPGCGRPVGGDDLDRMIRAQKEAATWQDKSVQTALTASAQTVQNLNAAIGSLIRLQQLQVEAQSHAPAATSNGDDDIVNLLPSLARKLLGPGDDDGLTPERLAKLGAMLDAMPAPAAERKGPQQASKPGAPPQASKPAPANGANGAH